MIQLRPRFLARVYAALLGFFWMPCSACGTMFGGQEWLNPGEPHESAIPDLDNPYGGTGICPSCTRAGIGCYVNARFGRWAIHDCEHFQRGLLHRTGRADVLNPDSPCR